MMTIVSWRIEAELQEPHPRNLGQVEIEQRDVELLPSQRVACLLAARADGHLIALVPQHARTALPQRTIVIDDQHADASLQLGRELCQSDDISCGTACRAAPVGYG